MNGSFLCRKSTFFQLPIILCVPSDIRHMKASLREGGGARSVTEGACEKTTFTREHIVGPGLFQKSRVLLPCISFF